MKVAPKQFGICHNFVSFHIFLISKLNFWNFGKRRTNHLCRNNDCLRVISASYIFLI